MLIPLAARQPLRVGLLLILVAAVFAILVVLAAFGDDVDWAGLLIALPPLVSGALLVAASRRR